MSVVTTGDQPSIGALLRRWREDRELSQLRLASRAEVSTRHLSFIETGRSKPSREMVIHLAEALDVPLRERNQMLLCAGYAPAYSETPLDAPRLDMVLSAVRQVLQGHEPCPAVAVDRHWDMVEANGPIAWLVEGAPDELLEPPFNVLRYTLHPRGLSRSIVNLGEWRAHILHRLHRQVETTLDPDLRTLLEELRDLPGPPPPAEHRSGAVVVPLKLDHRGLEVSLFSTVTTFGTPLDITVSELAIEAFYPADQTSASALARLAAQA